MYKRPNKNVLIKSLSNLQQTWDNTGVHYSVSNSHTEYNGHPVRMLTEYRIWYIKVFIESAFGDRTLINLFA